FKGNKTKAFNSTLVYLSKLFIFLNDLIT